eukprot:comp8522_c0_seq1/m.3829 comp8522_c0_seq1/g.3829  ORF comp8522_c0_seq1/g.3829 comp8522_c0_seq1/m.3829 type:complete len:217 (-) comp8522_c0_seq1:116-766(-)
MPEQATLKRNPTWPTDPNKRHWDRMVSGEYYKGFDEELLNMRAEARVLVSRFNELPITAVQEREEIMKKLFGPTGKNAYFEPPIRVDYGKNLSVGDNFYCNFGCVFLDCAPITIGDNCMLAPNVQFYPATHPLDPVIRTAGWEYALPIKVGHNVWIGGSTIINPGVTIGDNVVIGSGSVVTKDIPDNVVAAGNPCRVIRKITPSEDRKGMPDYQPE